MQALQAEEAKQQPLFQDKILNQLNQEVIFLCDFVEFPKFNIPVGHSGINFDHYSQHKGIEDVN